MVTIPTLPLDIENQIKFKIILKFFQMTEKAFVFNSKIILKISFSIKVLNFFEFNYLLKNVNKKYIKILLNCNKKPIEA